MDAFDLQVDPPLHVGLISKSRAVLAEEVAFIAAALAVQIRDHVCPTWKLKPIHVAAYLDGAVLPPSLAAVLYLVDTDGNPDSLGYHAAIAGLCYGFVDVAQTRAAGAELSAVASHEAIELVLNRHLDRWIWVPSLDLYLWREGADPCEDLTYSIDVMVAGVHRSIIVSDFIRPEYFDAAGPGPGDWLKRIGPLEITPGGYQVAKTTTGRIVSLPTGSASAIGKVAAKQARVLSRVTRRTARRKT